MKKFVSLFTVLIFVIGFVVLGGQSVRAAATITTPATGDISSDSYGAGTSVSLPNIVIAEGATGDINISTHVWTLPTGYVFDTTSVPDVTYTGTGLAGDAIAAMAASIMTIETTGASSGAGTMTIGSVTPIKVRVSAGCTMAAADDISMTGGTIAGLSSADNFGTLTQVTGTMTSLAVRLPGQAAPSCAAPAGTVTEQVVDVAFNITNIYAVDQYFNTDTSYTGAKTLVYAGPTGSPSYTTAVTFASGVSSTTLATTLKIAEKKTITVTDTGSYDLASSLQAVNPVLIADLTCESSGQAGAVWLRWTVPAGTSAGYETKYQSGNTITYISATAFSQSWASGTVGTAQQQLLTGLNPNTQYTFGAKAQGADSTISAVSGTTPSCYSPGASASLQDATAPTSSITFPAYNSVLLAGQLVVIKGNANDAGGSSIQKVEVSLDGGNNWSLAQVMAEDIDANRMWEYTWTNPAVGAYTIMSRAYDWVGNMETPGTGIQMTVATSVPETTVTTTTTTTIPPVLTTDEVIRAQIVTLQTQLVELLQQLLSMLMAQIAQLGL